jgi:hypothetical protein
MADRSSRWWATDARVARGAREERRGGRLGRGEDRAASDTAGKREEFDRARSQLRASLPHPRSPALAPRKAPSPGSPIPCPRERRIRDRPGSLPSSEVASGSLCLLPQPDPEQVRLPLNCPRGESLGSKPRWGTAIRAINSLPHPFTSRRALLAPEQVEGACPRTPPCGRQQWHLNHPCNRAAAGVSSSENALRGELREWRRSAQVGKTATASAKHQLAPGQVYVSRRCGHVIRPTGPVLWVRRISRLRSPLRTVALVASAEKQRQGSPYEGWSSEA